MHRQKHQNRPHSGNQIREIHLASTQDREQILQAAFAARGPSQRLLLRTGQRGQIPWLGPRTSRTQSGRAFQSLRPEILRQNGLHARHSAAAAHRVCPLQESHLQGHKDREFPDGTAVI